jgi:glycolate oxidase FAD binding subunit
MSASAIERFRDALEPGIFAEQPGTTVDDREVIGVLSPGDPESLARVLALLSEHEIPVFIRGGGTRMGLGNASDQASVLLSTRSLTGVRRYEPDDGVVEVSAGTPLDEVRKAVLDKGWELPIDAGGARATVGGAIASAAYGPRCLGFGPVRRNVLGLEVVDASGTLTKCGGRVVKNVTGYDLAKIYTGSLGTLGVISGAWLRLQPKPRAIEVRVGEFSQSDQALAAGILVSRRSSARACVLLSPEVARRVGLEHSLAASWILLAEFAGEESECQHDARWFESELGGRCPAASSGEASLALIDAVRESLTAGPEVASVRVRISALGTKLESCVRPLIKAGARMTVDPGLGLVHAEQVAGSDPEQVNAFIDVARAAAQAASGALVFESIPSELKRNLDVFGDGLGGELAVMRRLKQEFDPKRLLNPGRFVGGI